MANVVLFIYGGLFGLLCGILIKMLTYVYLYFEKDGEISATGFIEQQLKKILDSKCKQGEVQQGNN